MPNHYDILAQRMLTDEQRERSEERETAYVAALEIADLGAMKRLYTGSFTDVRAACQLYALAQALRGEGGLPLAEYIRSDPFRLRRYVPADLRSGPTEFEILTTAQRTGVDTDSIAAAVRAMELFATHKPRRMRAF